MFHYCCYLTLVVRPILPKKYAGLILPHTLFQYLTVRLLADICAIYACGCFFHFLLLNTSLLYLKSSQRNNYSLFYHSNKFLVCLSIKNTHPSSKIQEMLRRLHNHEVV